MSNINEWNKYYELNMNKKPFVAESFVARCFLSQRPVKMLSHYNFKKKKILDIGCGDGRHIDFFEKLKFNVFGVEISNQQVVILKERFPNSTFREGKSVDLPFENNFFDYLVAINSIYYLEDNTTIEDNIYQCASKIKKGGIMLLSFIGKKHFIFSKNQTHQCKGNVKIKSIDSQDELEEIFTRIPNLKIDMIGYIQDELNGYNREIYYAVVSKV